MANSHGRSSSGGPSLAQGPMGAQEALLERVLGLLARAEHVAAEAEQRAVVAVVEHLERALVTGRRELGEPGVVGTPKAERAAD